MGAEFVGAGGGGFEGGEEIIEAGFLRGVLIHTDVLVDLEEAGEGHAGESKGAQGFGQDGGIGGFDVAVIKEVHVVLEHGSFAEQVAHFSFGVKARGEATQVASIEAVAEGV